MAEIEDIESWVGSEVVDTDGEKIGKLDELYVDPEGNTVDYGLVKSGLLGRKHIVSFAGATFSRGHVRVAHAKDVVMAAPGGGSDGLTNREVGVLGQHYGVEAGEASGSPDDVRLETATTLTERRERAQEDLRRAEQLEAEAATKGDQAGRLHEDAEQREKDAATSEAERTRLLDEAADARRAAEGS